MITASTHCKMQLEKLIIKNIVALGAFWKSSPGAFGAYPGGHIGSRAHCAF